MPGAILALWPLVRTVGGLFLGPLVNPVNWPAIALVGAVAWGMGWWKGDAHGDAQCEARIARDKAAQDSAIKEAGEETIRILDRWLTDSAKLTELEAALNAAAQNDPNAGRACIGSDSLRRINRVKGKSRRSGNPASR